ncbi:MAG: tRNA (N6-threonylcarbamoyladenosine(37)-N6)-methyltransferase TrmO [Cytophagales bacterium]|nr:tRNA (N6-threonylcarbamoyladenosine(37)-N6)-methyltransferase TrmO [Cytophagales bacterium]
MSNAYAQFQFKPIGVIHSSLKKLSDCPRQESENAPEAVIEIFKAFEGAASHLLPGDEVILLTWLDKADRSTLTTHPRNDLNTELTGVFSTRSPDRPNPVGLHTVKITEKLGNGTFKVLALDVLDGTPIVDIKSGPGK